MNEQLRAGDKVRCESCGCILAVVVACPCTDNGGCPVLTCCSNPMQKVAVPDG